MYTELKANREMKNSGGTQKAFNIMAKEWRNAIAIYSMTRGMKGRAAKH